MIEEKEIHLRDYLNVIQKRKATVGCFFLIVLVLVLIISYATTSVYSANNKMLIEKNDHNQLLENNTYVQYDSKFLETQTQIIKSKTVAEKVVRLLDLENTHESFMLEQQGFPIIQAIVNWIKTLFSTVIRTEGSETGEGLEDPSESRVKELTELISDNITVSPVTDSRIVTINFTSFDPTLAASVTNTVAKAYIEELLEMRLEYSSNSINYMTKKAEEERRKLEKAEASLQKYMKDQDIVTIEDRMTILPQTLTQLSRLLTDAQTHRKELEAVYQKVKSVTDSGGDSETIPVIAANTTLKALNKDILRARQNIMELSKKYGPRHPMMKNAKSDLEMLMENRDSEIRRDIKSIENEYELAMTAEKNLQTRLSKTKADIVDLNERFVQYNMLKREVKTNQTIYDALVTKIKEQSVTEQAQNVNVWVVEEAKVPEFPVEPNIPRNLLLGIIIGLFGGIGLAFFLEYLDNTVNLPEDIEQRFGQPVLGLVPLDKEMAKNGNRKFLTDGPSAFSESFKTIRSNIQLSTYDSPLKSILVSSSTLQDGKTTSAVYLAIAMSHVKKKVLLLDADLRRPKIHKVFNLDNTMGLSAVIAGVSNMKVIQRSCFDNLDIMPSGPIPPNPSELVGSERFRTVMKVLTEKYDTIIIDSPPLLPVMDALLISKIVGGVVLVARASKTTNDAVYRGLKQLTDIQAKLLGFVISGVDMKKNACYYCQQYPSYYGSEEAE